MKVAVPVFGLFVSPRADCANTFQLFEITGGQIVSKETYSPINSRPFDLIDWLCSKNIELLICGGIPLPLLQALEFNRIKVLHGVTGMINEVIDAYAKGRLEQDYSLQFGWRGNRACRRGGRRFRGGPK